MCRVQVYWILLSFYAGIALNCHGFPSGLKVTSAASSISLPFVLISSVLFKRLTESCGIPMKKVVAVVEVIFFEVTSNFVFVNYVHVDMFCFSLNDSCDIISFYPFFIYLKKTKSP